MKQLGLLGMILSILGVAHAGPRASVMTLDRTTWMGATTASEPEQVNANISLYTGQNHFTGLSQEVVPSLLSPTCSYENSDKACVEHTAGSRCQSRSGIGFCTIDINVPDDPYGLPACCCQ